MLLSRFLIVRCLIASALVLTVSCAAERKADIQFLPAPPPTIFARDGDPRPKLPPAALGSEALYETWVSDIDDWGQRRDVQLWRGCLWVNTWLPDAAKLDCGAAPATRVGTQKAGHQ